MRIGFPTRLARVRDFLAAPADLIAYMAEHCADTDAVSYTHLTLPTKA